MHPSWRAGLVLALALAGAPAVAAEDVESAVRACRSEPDDGRRLACYDGAVDGKAAAPAPTPEENFGREHRIEHERLERQHEEARALGGIEATVASIETRMDGLMTITLDNGQVWRQNAPDSRFRLKVGDLVKIQPGSLKSFILSGPTKRSTRVSRVE